MSFNFIIQMKRFYNILVYCLIFTSCIYIASCDKEYDPSGEIEIPSKKQEQPLEIQDDTIITNVVYSLFDDSITLPYNVVFHYGKNGESDFYTFAPEQKDTIKHCMFEESKKLSDFGNFRVDWSKDDEGVNIKDVITECSEKDPVWYFVSGFHAYNGEDHKLIKVIHFREDSTKQYFLFSAITTYLIEDDGTMKRSNWY